MSTHSKRIIPRGSLHALALAAGVAAFALPAGSAVADASNCSQSGETVTCTYTTPGETPFVVPAGVSSVTATVVGAQGTGNPIPGGLGAQVSGTLAVAPGATLYANVDVLGGSGGTAGWAGGGESDLRTCSAAATCASGGTLDSRLLVAGGGGSSMGGGQGGNAGTTGAAGDGGSSSERGSAAGGTGATPSTYGTGGAGGGVDCAGNAGSDGTFGVGGSGGGPNDCDVVEVGGGGGGGWFGGGGGGASGRGTGGGGGGGSSHVDPSVTGATFSQASAGQAPSVTITYVLPDSTPPSDQPVISGTLGSNGWYTSDVTVAWNWTDSGSGVDTANCTQSSVSSGEGSAVTISSTCQDVAGNAASDSVTVKIDKTSPAVNCPSPAPVFALGATGSMTATVSDATSGPAQATISAASDTSSGGAKTVSLTGQDNAGNATAVSCPYAVGYGFGGFTAPLPKSTLTRSGSTIPVKFTLTDGSGHPIAPSTAAALASAGQVKATLTGPGITPQSVQCSWDSSDRMFQCNVKTPSGLKTGTANPYTITASENLGGGFITAPVVGAAGNPETVYFK